MGGIIMRKKFLSLFLCVFILSSCNSSKENNSNISLQKKEETTNPNKNDDSKKNENAEGQNEINPQGYYKIHDTVHLHASDTWEVEGKFKVNIKGVEKVYLDYNVDDNPDSFVVRVSYTYENIGIDQVGGIIIDPVSVADEHRRLGYNYSMLSSKYSTPARFNTKSSGNLFYVLEASTSKVYVYFETITAEGEVFRARFESEVN